MVSDLSPIPKKSRVERIIDQINANNAKKSAVILVIGFICYHELVHLRYGANSCIWLLSDGRYKGDQEWQPYGCMLHRYSNIDTRRCLRYIAFYGTETYFAFIGDSRIRQLYLAFVGHLEQTDTNFDDVFKQRSSNLSHVDNKLKIKVEYIFSLDVSQQMSTQFRNWQNMRNPPSVIISGCGIWSIKSSNASEHVVDEYQVNLTRLVQPIDRLRENKSRVLWMLQAPVDTEKLPPDHQIITNTQIDAYNKAAIEVLKHSATDLWWSARLVAQGMMSESPDGIHLPPRALLHETQILLNMYCNDNMNFNDGTCCSSAETYTTLQIVTYAILVVCVITTVVMFLYRLVMKWRGFPVFEYAVLVDPDVQASLPAGSAFILFKSISTLAMIMGYFFVCDRTNFFMKENKYYSEFSFWLPVGYVCALGMFFTEDSKFTKVLHRDQINEWKGWMQLIILVYQLTGASRILSINMHIKVLISSYLFLLGYEQFCYFWHRGDYSIVGFFKTLFQLNFMTVTLCLCMNRPYQFYYFVPLMSFWYVMIYTVLVLPPQITAQSTENNIKLYFYLVLKFVGFFTVVTILFMSEVFFEKIFVTRPWKALFVTTDDDIHEWWSRWKLDRYSVIYGMCFAVILLLAQRYNLFDDNNHGNLFSRGIALCAILLAVIGLGCYAAITFLCRNELECSEIHSYVVFIPVVSYVVLRNISGVLRTRYSSLFAWFGKISLELFITQYHIWLAADTHGVLVLVPQYPVLNLIVSSFIFVCASHEVHRITKVLLPYAVPLEWKLVLRNFILFLAVLVPIGINDGMF